MTIRTFILFDPETNLVTGTITADSMVRETMIAASNKADISQVRLGDGLKYDPVENLLYFNKEKCDCLPLVSTDVPILMDPTKVKCEVRVLSSSKHPPKTRSWKFWQRKEKK